VKAKLTEDEKQLTDVLQFLQSHAFNSFNERRKQEWKLSFSLWGALVILLGFLLKGDVAPLETAMQIGLTFATVTVIVLHGIWMKGVGRRNRADIHSCYFWEKTIRDTLDVKYEQEHEDTLKELRATSGYFKTFSLFFELGVTIVLALALICATWGQEGSQQLPASDSNKAADAVSPNECPE